MDGFDLSGIYQLRKSFTVVALTGRKGCGCAEVGKLFEEGFKESNYPEPYFNSKEDTSGKMLPVLNSHRKYRIIYDYAKGNFKPYKIIKYKDVLTLFIVKESFQSLIDYLDSANIKESFVKSELIVSPDFSKEINEIKTIAGKFDFYHQQLVGIDFDSIRTDEELKSLYDIFFNEEFLNFSESLHRSISSTSDVKRIKFLQIVTNNLRNGGNPYLEKGTALVTVYKVAELINRLIKAYKKNDTISVSEERCQVLIDSLRNPLEIMYFKERYSAFYMISVNRETLERQEELESRYSTDYPDIIKIDLEEHKGGEDNEFYKQDVSECIQKSDIHFNNISIEKAKQFNEAIPDQDDSSHQFSLSQQLLKYVALITQPGIITPSPEERCMQFAYTAKSNSGCISRQVGAIVTDKNYSIKAVGWNNTPEGQVPCILRNVGDLIDQKNDTQAFTDFEKNDEEFRDELKVHYKPAANPTFLQGRNVCFCFKSIKNSYSEGKNQVHTRSLHAEENAFLQITKYGGQGIDGGKLFTTASPCELCAKKAYQLGVKVIYYIDPYPGISIEQILKGGAKERNPEIRLFYGAIGMAYYKLYQPFMAYKDELGLILGQNIKDQNRKLKDEVARLTKEIKEIKDKGLTPAS